MKSVIVDSEIVTPLGLGLDPCWEGVCRQTCAFKPLDRFDLPSADHCVASTIDGLTYHQSPSLVEQMLAQIFQGKTFPSDIALMLATTTGEVDLLEQTLLQQSSGPNGSLNVLLHNVQEDLGLNGPASLISSACTSSTAAIALASNLIESGVQDAVLVVACDAVTEFVFTGFSSLMALDPDGARPFDADRQGLTVGEAAGYLLLMSEQRARSEGRHCLGRVTGWGLSNDANHMTGPCRRGDGLARAIRQALRVADRSVDDIGMICAHGTGTRYNDTMEMLAFKQVFPQPRPVFSVKGILGHTMGAAGLLETLMTLKALAEKVVPASAGIAKLDEDMVDWVVTEQTSLQGGSLGLTTNSGFGGANGALILAVHEDDVC